MAFGVRIHDPVTDEEIGIENSGLYRQGMDLLSRGERKGEGFERLCNGYFQRPAAAEEEREMAEVFGRGWREPS